MNKPNVIRNCIVYQTNISTQTSDGKLLYRSIPIEELIDTPYLQIVELLTNIKINRERYRTFLFNGYRIGKNKRFRNVISKTPILDIIYTLTTSKESERGVSNDDVEYIHALITGMMMGILSRRYGTNINIENDDTYYIASLINDLFPPIRKHTFTKPISKVHANLLTNMLLVIHAEHGMNASTFSALTSASAYTNPLPYALISGFTTLMGDLHGGANKKSMEQILYLSRQENPKQIIKQWIKEKKKIYGFGHRIYKNYDPRYKAMEVYFNRYYYKTKIQNIVKMLVETVLEELSEKQVYPNVDLLSGWLMNIVNIPHSMFTYFFAMARITGWLAHIKEYKMQGGKIIRPLHQSPIRKEEI